MALTERQRISLLMMRGWGDRQRSLTQVVELFNDTFRDENVSISKSTASRTITRFHDTGSVKDRPRSGRPKSATDDEKSLEVMQSFIEDPHTSIRRAAQYHDVSVGSVHSIMKKNHFHPYKIKLTHELLEDDFDRRTEFCEVMMNMIEEDPQLPNNIVFSDEATFQLSGNVNSQDFRYWADVNPHWMRENKTQYPEKLNVWAGIFKGRVVGPFFIDGTLDGVNYLNMLRQEIVPAIQQIAGNDFADVYFQQDGAPAHYFRPVRNYLNEVFPQRWIGRRGSIEWPPRSPDLTPLDFFYWGYLKSKVYSTKPNNLQDLRQRIVHETDLIEDQTFRNVIDSFYNRLAYCLETEGHQFEQLL